jgi:hypothetical protein
MLLIRHFASFLKTATWSNLAVDLVRFTYSHII